MKCVGKLCGYRVMPHSLSTSTRSSSSNAKSSASSVAMADKIVEAIKKADIETVRTLGEYVNYPTSDNQTAIFFAVFKFPEDREIIHTLLTLGADPYLQYKTNSAVGYLVRINSELLEDILQHSIPNETKLTRVLDDHLRRYVDSEYIEKTVFPKLKDDIYSNAQTSTSAQIKRSVSEYMKTFKEYQRSLQTILTLIKHGASLKNSINFTLNKVDVSISNCIYLTNRSFYKNEANRTVMDAAKVIFLKDLKQTLKTKRIRQKAALVVAEYPDHTKLQKYNLREMMCTILRRIIEYGMFHAVTTIFSNENEAKILDRSRKSEIEGGWDYSLGMESYYHLLSEMHENSDIGFKKFIQQAHDFLTSVHNEIVQHSSHLLDIVRDAYSAIFRVYGSDTPDKIKFMLYAPMYYMYLNKLSDNMEHSDMLKQAVVLGAGPLLVKVLQKYAGNNGISEQLRTLLSSTLERNVPVLPCELDIIKRHVKQRAAFVDDASFKSKPLSVASIGQVHKIVLRNGENAVLKFVKPRALFSLHYEYRALTNSAIDRDVLKTCMHMCKGIAEEMDFANEESNITIGNLIYKNQDGTIRSIKSFSVKKDKRSVPIIVMDLAKGKSLKTLLNAKHKDHGLKVLPTMKQLVACWVKGALLTTPGHAHVDLHPGNLIVHKNVITVIDYGNMIEVSRSIQCAILNIMIRHNSMVSVDKENVTSDIRYIINQLNSLCKLQINADKEASVVDHMTAFLSSDPNRMYVGSFLQEAFNYLGSYGSCLGGSVFDLIKGIQLLEQSLKELLRVVDMPYESLISITMSEIKSKPLLAASAALFVTRCKRM